MYPITLQLVDQQRSFGVNKWSGNAGQSGASGLDSCTGLDPVGGFGARKCEIVKNQWGPVGMTTPDDLAPAPHRASIPVGTGPPHPYNQSAQGINGGQAGYGMQPAHGSQGP